MGVVRVKVSYWQDSIPLSSRLCPSFFVSFASSQASLVFRLVYRPYRSFRFVFSSLVVSTSFVSFASHFVLCLTFSSFFVLLFSFNLFLLNKQFSFLYEFVSSCEVLLTHGLAHPCVKTTQRLVSKKFVWPGLNKQVGTWTK